MTGYLDNSLSDMSDAATVYDMSFTAMVSCGTTTLHFMSKEMFWKATQARRLAKIKLFMRLHMLQEKYQKPKIWEESLKINKTFSPSYLPGHGE